MAQSLKLRKKIVFAYEAGFGSYQRIADIFQVGVCSVKRFVQKSRKNQSLECLLYKGGRKPGVADDELPFIEQMILNKPEITIAQIQAKFQEIRGRKISKQMVETALRKMNLTKKKKALWQLSKKRNAL